MYSGDSDRDYSEEYRSLVLRCEVMEAEGEEIEGRMAQLRRGVTAEETQVEQIDRQEAKIRAQIQELQERWAAAAGFMCALSCLLWQY